jgi:hypothetical protein
MSSTQDQVMAQAQRVVAKAWADPAFKAALLADANGALAAEGIAVPAGMRLKVVENVGDLVHLVLPAPPSAALSDEEVGAVAGGTNWVCLGPMCGGP